MLIVKVMSAEDTHDTDPRKSFMLHSGVVEAHFERRGDGSSDDPKTFVQPWLTLRFSRKIDDREVDDAISFEPSGNVYVMNENGKTIASYGVAPIIYAASDDPRGEIGRLVDRVLSWRLPRDFNPDNGISFVPPVGPHTEAHWPMGTNLFNYDQAKAMLEHVLK